ncbi:MYL5 protein, partial [Polypterus senegalus]
MSAIPKSGIGRSPVSCGSDMEKGSCRDVSPAAKSSREKQAFTLIDQNRDGFIDKEDLKDTYASLGKLNVKDDELEGMLKEATGPINFTMFLNLFGEKLHGTDPEETILNAFKMFDPENKGHIPKDVINLPYIVMADKWYALELSQKIEIIKHVRNGEIVASVCGVGRKAVNDTKRDADKIEKRVKN